MVLKETFWNCPKLFFKLRSLDTSVCSILHSLCPIKSSLRLFPKNNLAVTISKWYPSHMLAMLVRSVVKIVHGGYFHETLNPS